MQDFDELPPGAPSDPEERLLGELLGTLSELKARYQTEDETLAWAVHRAFSRHLIHHEGVETWVRFREKLVASAKDTLNEIDAILDNDARQHRLQ